MSTSPDPRCPSVSLGLRAGLSVAALVTLLVAAVGRLVPETWSGTAIAVVFLGATYLFSVRGRENEVVRAFGLELGGVLSERPLDPWRMALDTVRAFSQAVLAAVILFPPFLLGFVWWWRPEQPFDMIPLVDVANDLFGQLFAIALPEEAFYRGFLQTTLAFGFARTRLSPRGAVFFAVLVTSAIFALGHLATAPQPARLAVFFPSLLFGWLRVRSRGIGSAIWFHAFCNTFASVLGQSYGLFR